VGNGAMAADSMSSARTSVLIVDDHAAFRAAAARMLEAAGFAVVGEAATGAEAIAAVAECSPELVLLDVQLPDRDGISVAEHLSVQPVPPCVVLISGRDPAVYGERLAHAPARGFIPKSRLSGARLAELVG
jgi:DNA-binding NarL/FixJ family response regulator